ncbi:hypothetical protein [Spirosoma spitsbergense]|uniref:hypothetical protein n=1 Tax=Spirosoma spitsbergense TaxID=431554 RepID=UPI0003690FF8|nr:hypothetical protein [Spirosoma spitsbergense]
MTLTNYGFLTILLLGSEFLYLRLARHFRLFDIPNERSLHQTTTTIRGGGIVIYLAVLITVFTGSFNQPWFFGGLTAVVLVSFGDDLTDIPVRFRLSVQLIAVSLLLIQTGTFPTNWWAFPGLLLLGVAVINACNFMDGINGMAALYSLVTVGTLWYVQGDKMDGGSQILYPSVFVALLIFSFFNARPKAICFAGDVGSIGIGFITLYGLLNVINEHHTYLPLLLLAVYGTDTLLTLFYRFRQHQNVLRAHRSHLYQLLVSQRGWPHLGVATGYAFVQIGINGLVLWALEWPIVHQLILAGLVLCSLSILYVATRTKVMST